MRSINFIAYRKSIRRASFVPLVGLSILGLFAVASESETVTVYGDARFSDCSNSGGTYYTDNQGNYAGCYYKPSDSSIGDTEPGGGSGGGGDPPPDLTERDISPELQCALDTYLHPNVKLTAGRTMKQVSTWAFGFKTDSGWKYEFNSTNVSPGVDWKPIGGIASPDAAYGRIYYGAFVAGTRNKIDGSRADAQDNSLSGVHLTSFEASLFVSGHEASHLSGNLNEAEANWYGIDAVLKYKSDGGAQCAGS